MFLLMERGLAFDRVAEAYDRVRPGYPGRLLDGAFGGRAIRDVLEVGCGTGQLTVDLIGRGLRVEAVEPGPKLALIAGRRAPMARIRVGRFEDVELADASFDALFSATAFHWVDPRVGWAKAARVLRQGGILALLGHVYVTDAETRSTQEALRDIYEAPWQLRDEEDLVEGALLRLDNISALWGWIENPVIAVAEAGTLFGDVRFDAVPQRIDLSAAELLDLQRTTATHLSLDLSRRDRVEQAIPKLVARLGGSFPIRQLAVLAVAERR
jgi:SAM-dependent methyltransferase